MAIKFVVLSCLVAVASAGLIPTAQLTYSAPQVTYSAPQVTYSAPVYTSHAVQAAPIAYAAPITKYATYAAPITKVAAIAPVEKVEDYAHNAQYSYSYDVQDGHTGDSKSHYETRDGDVVKGAYSVVDPDGSKRTVEYTADPHNGFNAVVHREPLEHVTKVISPVAKVAAPVAYASAPVYHSSPVYHAAPVAYSAPAYSYHH